MPTEADDSAKSVGLALQRVFHDLQVRNERHDACIELLILVVDRFHYTDLQLRVLKLIYLYQKKVLPRPFKGFVA